MTDARRVVIFTIPGRAVPKQRPRMGKGGNVYTPRQTVAYEEAVAWCALSSGLRLKAGDRVMIEVDFYLCPVTGDADNRLKVIGDGLQRAYPEWDDRHVRYVSGQQHEAESKREQRTVIRVEVMF